MDNAPTFQYKCTETEQMNVQTYFPPSHGKEIRLGGLGIKPLECVPFCSGKHFINDTIRSEFHRKFMDKYVRWRSLLTDAYFIIHHCILVHAHIHTHSVVHSCYSELVSFQHIIMSTPTSMRSACIHKRTSNVTFERNDLWCNGRSAARPSPGPAYASQDTPSTLR